MLRDAEVIQDDAQWLCTKIFVPLLRSSVSFFETTADRASGGHLPPRQGCQKSFCAKRSRRGDFVEWGPGDKNDEGYLVEELAEALPTHLSIIKTILLLQSEPVGSDEENVVRFKRTPFGSQDHKSVRF